MLDAVVVMLAGGVAGVVLAVELVVELVAVAALADEAGVDVLELEEALFDAATGILIGVVCVGACVGVWVGAGIVFIVEAAWLVIGIAGAPAIIDGVLPGVACMPSGLMWTRVACWTVCG